MRNSFATKSVRKQISSSKRFHPLLCSSGHFVEQLPGNNRAGRAQHGSAVQEDSGERRAFDGSGPEVGDGGSSSASAWQRRRRPSACPSPAARRQVGARCHCLLLCCVGGIWLEWRETREHLASQMRLEFGATDPLRTLKTSLFSLLLSSFGLNLFPSAISFCFVRCHWKWGGYFPIPARPTSRGERNMEKKTVTIRVPNLLEKYRLEYRRDYNAG